jgi:hypothetical protein
VFLGSLLNWKANLKFHFCLISYGFGFRISFLKKSFGLNRGRTEEIDDGDGDPKVKDDKFAFSLSIMYSGTESAKSGSF